MFFLDAVDCFDALRSPFVFFGLLCDDNLLPEDYVFVLKNESIPLFFCLFLFFVPGKIE